MAFPSNLLNPGEHVVVSTRSHVKALIVPVLVGVLLVVAVVVLSRLTDSTLAGGAAGIVAVLVALWFVVRPAVKWLTTTYTFTNRRFIKRSGLISKEGRTIPLNRISGVDFEIGVVDRLFGCGTLVISDASEQGRVELRDVPRVEEVQRIVAEELHHLSDRRTSDDGT